uniref:Uncharacterized protein n=1 Tax=Arundo donax TaxID=35708 RepID=A0A0A9G2U0_ARUDO
MHLRQMNSFHMELQLTVISIIVNLYAK